ncbi:helix-turn-helix domain-containing protein [Corynebacterium ureicelerivorans]|uniref:HTH cro/C1-type domain-containing protein n=1 Tax=Corynebacterium ureicelerivorans TaxID=401472 RepID=A0A077HN77_9CORY|nr:helix-turn-helix domain-containing protein [Corynebacterium ureicelerivorans]AIL96401.1 hypothetical protein CUREI_02985 [Corynebacterium ureicelerivorans]AIL97805.1 hypothetical protein CUREI_11520 [Corynebacterium ureicelerivorans]DAI86680.1 MAG TPA: Middle operon regulator, TRANSCRIPTION.2A [Caudoviricetes sp.]
MDSEHDELLAAAVEAHQDYEGAVEAAKAARRLEFQRAVDGGVSRGQIARRLGRSTAWVSRIVSGDR